MINHKRLTLFAGHYGSGKTNIAVNMAEELRTMRERVAVADLDIVNPYFRTRDSEDELKEAGIRTRVLHKPSEHSEEMLDSIRAGYVSYVINTRAVLSGVHYGDGVALRSIAAQNNVVMLTSLDTVRMLLDVLEEVTMGISTIDAE